MLIRSCTAFPISTVQFDFLSAQHEQQCFFKVFEFDGVFFSGGSTTEFLEGFDVQHGRIVMLDT